MSEKQFRVRFEQEDGRGEIVNKKGVKLTAREVMDLLNEQQDTISRFGEENEQLREQVDNLQEALAEAYATLILNGFEVDVDGKILNELIDDE